LGVKLSPESPDFNPRLASFIKEFSVRSPSQLQISFHRVPLNLEALFTFPIHEPSADRTEEGELLSKRFELVDQSDDRRLYRRSVPEPNDLNERLYHVAEVEEIKFDDRDEVIRAFRREQVDVIPHLRPWEVDLFMKFPDQYAVQQYAIPQTHVIVFNPLSEKVTSPQLRRALSLGVDRESLLKIVLLRDPEMKYGRPVSAPWHTGSYANSPLVEPPRYDHYLSYLLRMTALEKLRIPFKQKFVADAKQRVLDAGEDWNEEVFRNENAEQIDAAGAHIELPPLKMLVDPDDVVMLAAEKIAERWRLLGFEIELVSAATEGEESDDWDMMYRTARMKEPLLELWSLLLTDDSFDVTRLVNYPDWMRQELINLDYATSFTDAQQKLYTIHRHMAAQAFLIPLWEIDDFMVFPRTRVKNFDGRPLSVYHGLEQWTLVP
jgi:ABC-type transport system substrate-binding protein